MTFQKRGTLATAGFRTFGYAFDDDLNLFRRGVQDFPQPGNAAGLESADPSTYSVLLLRARAIADGLAPVAPKDLDKPTPEGFYKVALFVAHGVDYHWYTAIGSSQYSFGQFPFRSADRAAAGCETFG